MKIIKNISIFCGIVFSIFFVSFVVLAWSSPGAAPTGGNVALPINVGSGSQIKVGNLTLGNLGVNGYVGVGVSPTQKLDINGNMRVRGHIYDSSNNIIYNNSTKKIPRERLPFSEGDIVSTAGGAYNIANLSPNNVRSGIRYGINQTGTLSCPACNSCCPTCSIITGIQNAITQPCGGMHYTCPVMSGWTCTGRSYSGRSGGTGSSGCSECSYPGYCFYARMECN